MNPHFRYAFAYWFAIAEVAIFCTINSHLDASGSFCIFQPCEPVIKYFRCLN